MGYRDPFSLYPRKTKGGKIIWYYRTYDEYGKRTSGKSTGQINNSSARHYVTELIKKGALTTKGNITFSKFSEDWWIWDKCQYTKSRLARGRSITPGYVDINRCYLERHILPFFGNIRLSNINTRMIENWVMKLREDKERNLSPTTINHCLTTLKIMLKQAVRLEYIPTNPASTIEQLGSVAPGLGRFVNRVLDLNTYKERVINGKPYPHGDFLCVECGTRLEEQVKSA